MIDVDAGKFPADRAVKLALSSSTSNKKKTTKGASINTERSTTELHFLENLRS